MRDVETMTLENHMPSFFLAETCKYLHLLFDDSFLEKRNVVFSTEGHPLPVFARRSDEENDAEDDATTSRKLGDEETPRVPDPLAPFESREFVRVVKSAVADAKRRARRERGSAEDDPRAGGGARDVRLTAPACVDSTSTSSPRDSASPDERYRPRVADPSSAMRDPRHAGAGWGATARVCPNLRCRARRWRRRCATPPPPPPPPPPPGRRRPPRSSRG